MTWLRNNEEEAIEYFWNRVGEKEVYPRYLERSILVAFPIAIVKLPHLALASIENWLKFRQITFSFNCESRFVQGCLIAYAGKGIIFCDGTDPIDEVRFTLAHETAQFLVDYWLPRQKAIEKFGNNIVKVLDGGREPTVTERIHATLETTAIGTVTNLMDRQEVNVSISRVENTADKIGFGLLAHPYEVLRGMTMQQERFQQRLEILTKRLITGFGLPKGPAQTYANELLRSVGKGPSWAESIRWK
jgi:hypothetical protein